MLMMPYAQPERTAVENYGLIPADRDEAEMWARRLVAERCIYGVDLNALAVELAKLSLWLVTLSKDSPFTFLDHRLRHGNSLIGASFFAETTIEIKKRRAQEHKAVGTEHPVRQITFIPDAALNPPKSADKDRKAAMRKRIKDQRPAIEKVAAGQMTLFADMGVEQVLRELVEQRDQLERPTRAAGDYDTKEALLHQVLQGGGYPILKAIADLWCAVWFWPRDIESHGLPPTTQEYHDTVYTVLEKPAIATTGQMRLRQIRQTAAQVAAEEAFFHWELEFPGVFTRENPGFDAIVGNPPWEVVKPNSQEFFEQYDPNFRNYGKQDALRIADDLMQAEPAVADAWKQYTTSEESQAAYFNSDLTFQHQGRGDVNTYKLFAEQGLLGLGILFSAHDEPEITFSDTESVPPLLLCRSCGQHYTRLIVGEWEASNNSSFAYRLAKIPASFEEPPDDSGWLYLTDQFHTQQDDDEDDGDARWSPVYVCPYCQTMHEKNEPRCLNPQCRASGSLTPMLAYLPENGGTPKRCGACGGPNTDRTPLISYTRSAGVADVTILVQSMLTMMSEPPLRKVLVFTDSRQEAAFQAGWMQERAKRFRLRHLAYQIVLENDHPIGWDNYAYEIIARAQQSGILPRRDFGDQDQQKRIHWFMIEEFAFTTQRRSNLEQLGLLGIVYGGLDDLSDPFFAHWAAQLGCSPDNVRDCIWLLLDMFRRRGILSDDLLARYWSDQDREVFQGLVSVPEFYHPSALVLQKTGKQNVLRGFLSKTGRSTAQVTMQKALGSVGANTRDTFLKAAWEWMVDNEHLIPVELVRRRRGQAEPIPNLPNQVYQINVHRVGISRANTRFVCTHCHRAQQVPTPSGKCPEYGCNGTLAEASFDMEHFDVVQYTRQEFVPVNVREHSAQVPRDRRIEAELQFKSEDGHVNAIVATPTLEMGVDIGKLEMVLMRNVPPTPANYAQRAGRAGRRHRIGVVFTYAGMSQHDRYFYADPPEAIAGAVRVPAFSMQNEPLIRKHVHSVTLTALREWANPDEQKTLQTIFPIFIGDYLVEWYNDGEQRRPRYFTSALSFSNLERLIVRDRSQLINRLNTLFSADWPQEDQHAVSAQVLSGYLDEMPQRLEQHIRQLFNQVKAYRDGLAELRDIEQNNEGLRPDERKKRQRLEQARDNYLKQGIENYALSWLAADGFFPGYALSRASVRAVCIQPLLEMSRPAAVALRELTPANWVYADGRVFSIQRLNFGKLRANSPQFTSDILREDMLLDTSNGRLYLPGQAMTEGGASDVQRIVSYELTDVEMERVQSIDDRQELRRRIAFKIIGTLLDQHSGGQHGRVGEKWFKFLRRETIRLVNLGPLRPTPTGLEGFPICPVCGETRSPWSTQVEIDHFREVHRERCGLSDVSFYALHVNLSSDVLVVGPYGDTAAASNAYEGLLIGARALLDMGGDELEGLFYTDEQGEVWSVLYDPLPGGTGFLPQLLLYWDTICERGIEALGRCDCKTSCYKCLRHFRNQQHHEALDRYFAIQLLDELRGVPHEQHEIPPRVSTVSDIDADAFTESPAEEKFLQELARRSFPTPTESQFTVNLGNGNYTVADFAWPEVKLIIFIDGTSGHLHGNPEQARKDRNKRLQAQVLHWNVIVITAQELDDETAMAQKLGDIEFILSR